MAVVFLDNAQFAEIPGTAAPQPTLGSTPAPAQANNGIGSPTSGIDISGLILLFGTFCTVTTLEWFA